jgi:hypothetical protein
MESFHIQKGVKQGYPFSSPLFIICIQLLTSTDTKDNNINDFKLNNKEIKQTLFADDSTYINNGQTYYFKMLIKVITEFGNTYISDLRLNKPSFFYI